LTLLPERLLTRYLRKRRLGVRFSLGRVFRRFRLTNFNKLRILHTTIEGMYGTMFLHYTFDESGGVSKITIDVVIKFQHVAARFDLDSVIRPPRPSEVLRGLE
jgi:hypothetical protein